MKKKVKPQTKEQAYSRVFGHLRELSEGQKKKFSFSILQIAALVELCELILILIIFALSAFGFIVQGIIISSLLVGSFVTNIVWFVLLRREKLADWQGRDLKKMERMTEGQAFKAMTGQLKELYQEQKKRFSYPYYSRALCHRLDCIWYNYLLTACGLLHNKYSMARADEKGDMGGRIR
jgi:hypothetical protein